MLPALTLRPLELADVPRVFEAVRESYRELSRWMAWCTPDFNDAGVGEFIERATRERELGLSHELGMFDERGDYIGTCGVNDINRVNRFANLGYWVRTSRTRRGYATAAARRLADWAFTETDLVRIEIVVAAGNLPSQRVAERVGAEREGMLRRRLLIHGVSHDAVMFSLVR